MTARHLPSPGMALAAGALLALATGAAEARPRAAEPVSPAGACERFGPGYKAVAGTDTCIKVSGTVRAELGVVLGGSGSGSGSDVGAFLSRPRR